MRSVLAERSIEPATPYRIHIYSSPRPMMHSCRKRRPKIQRVPLPTTNDWPTAEFSSAAGGQPIKVVPIGAILYAVPNSRNAEAFPCCSLL